MPDNKYTQKLTKDVVMLDIANLENFIGVLGNTAEHYNTDRRKQKDEKNQALCENIFKLVKCAKGMLSSAHRDVGKLDLDAL